MIFTSLKKWSFYIFEKSKNFYAFEKIGNFYIFEEIDNFAYRKTSNRAQPFLKKTSGGTR
jgi:hypothetical protein